MCFLQSGQHLLLVRSGMDLRLYRWKAFCPFRRHRKILENSLDSPLTRKMHVFIASVWSQLSENWRCSCQAPWSGAKIDSSNVALNGMGESRREDGIPKETIEPLDTFQSWLRLVQFVSRPCYVLIAFDVRRRPVARCSKWSHFQQSTAVWLTAVAWFHWRCQWKVLKLPKCQAMDMSGQMDGYPPMLLFVRHDTFVPVPCSDPRDVWIERRCRFDNYIIYWWFIAICL